MAIWFKKKQREKQTEQSFVTKTTPKSIVEDNMSRTTTSLSHGGSVPAVSTANPASDPKTPSRRRGGTNESKSKSQKQTRRPRRRPSQDSYSSSSSVFTIDRNPGHLLTIEPVSPLGSDFESTAIAPKKTKRRSKNAKKSAILDAPSAENITALPASHTLKTSPHLRPATKDNADIPYDFRHALQSNSRLGTPNPLQELQADRNAAPSPTKKRNVLSRTGSDRKTKPPHLATLPLKLSKKSSKRQPPLRDEDIRIMTAPAMRQFISGPYNQGILERDSQKIREGMNKRFARPQSTISLPRPDASTRPSTRMSSLGRPASTTPVGVEARSYRISVLDVLSPRPLIKVQEHPHTKLWGEDDDFENNPPMRPDTAMTKLSFGNQLGTHIGTVRKKSAHPKRVEDLADDMDASELRAAMERDKKRKEKKRDREAEKLKRRLERRAEKERAKEETGEPGEQRGEPFSNEHAVQDEVVIAEKSRSRHKKSKRAGKEPIHVHKKDVDEKSLPPEPVPPQVPPKELLPEIETEGRTASPIPSLPVFGDDPDEEEHRHGKAEGNGAKDHENLDGESHTSSPIEPMFPLQALPSLADRKEMGWVASARQPNMSLGPLLVSSAAAPGTVGLGGGGSMTALPEVPKKGRRRASIILGLFRRAAGKDQQEAKVENEKENENEKEKDKDKDNKRERRRSRAKSFMGSALAIGGKKSPENERDSRHDSVGPTDLLTPTSPAVAPANTTGTLSRIFSKPRSRAVTSTSTTPIPSSPPPKNLNTVPPRLVNLSREAVDSQPRPPATASSTKSPTLLRTRSIFKEQLSDMDLPESKISPMPGPYNVRSPTGEGQVFLRTPTPPELKPEPTLNASPTPRQRPENPFEAAAYENMDVETPVGDTKELGEIGSEGSWLTGKPVKRRPSTRGSSLTGQKRTPLSTKRHSESSSRYSDDHRDTLTHKSIGHSQLKVVHPGGRGGSTTGHDTDDNGSQSAYYDAESKRDPSTHDDNSDPEEAASPNPDDVVTPRPSSRSRSWLLSASSGNVQDDDVDWEEEKKKTEEAEMKIYGEKLGKTPSYNQGIRVKSSEGLLKEGLGSVNDAPPIPSGTT